jgi:pyruvate,orthophosphate dikinase
MFFEEERLPAMQKMILSAAEATALEEEVVRLQREIEAVSGRRQEELRHVLAEAERERDASPAVASYHSVLAELEGFQVEDFKGILRVMAGRPVIIRLLDPPLHEFLPSYESTLVEVTELRLRGDSSAELAEKESLLHAIEGMREANPMLGLRGCRLG